MKNTCIILVVCIILDFEKTRVLNVKNTCVCVLYILFLKNSTESLKSLQKMEVLLKNTYASINRSIKRENAN